MPVLVDAKEVSWRQTMTGTVPQAAKVDLGITDRSLRLLETLSAMEGIVAAIEHRVSADESLSPKNPDAVQPNHVIFALNGCQGLVEELTKRLIAIRDKL